MDLDEFKAKWAEQDRKLETSLRLNRQLLNAMHLNRAQSALQHLAWELAFEAVIELAGVVVLGSFAYEHRMMPQFVFPAVALDLVAIAILHGLIRQIVGALQIDYSSPVTTIQKQIEALRMLRIRCMQWIFLVAPLAWTPLLIVALKGFFGLDAYRIFSVAWLVANLLFGLVVIPLAIWLAKRYGDWLGRFPVMQRLMNDLLGHNLKAAIGFLATLTEFEDDK
jgi:hypothetical protein